MDEVCFCLAQDLIPRFKSLIPNPSLQLVKYAVSLALCPGIIKVFRLALIIFLYKKRDYKIVHKNKIEHRFGGLSRFSRILKYQNYLT